MTTGLGWVATAAAIAAIFVPGVNVLVWTAVGLTVASGLSHTMLAATGNGSWVDVGLDVFALVTFGMGLAAARGLQGAQQAARAAAATEAGDRAVALVRSGVNARSLPLHQISATRQIAERQVHRVPLASASRLQAFFVGGTNEARLLNDTTAMAIRHSGAPGMAEALRRGSIYYETAAASHLSGLGADLPGKASDVGDVSRWLYARSSWSGDR